MLVHTVAVNEKFMFHFHFYDHRTVHCVVKKWLVNKTDVNWMTVPTGGEKCTFRTPLIQNECSDIDCLSLFVAWPALHVWQDVPILIAESPHFTADDRVDHRQQTYLASVTAQRSSVHTSSTTYAWWYDGFLCRSETSRGLKCLFSTRDEQYDCRVAIQSHLHFVPIKPHANIIMTRTIYMHTHVLVNGVRTITLTPYYDRAMERSMNFLLATTVCDR